MAAFGGTRIYYIELGITRKLYFIIKLYYDATDQLVVLFVSF